MSSILSKAKLGTEPGGRPPSAVEITPEGVLAAVIPAPGQPPAYAYQPLPAGALLPGIGEPNVRAPEAVAAAIRTALDQASPRTRSVTVIIPDTVVRVFVLDFDSLPDNLVEALPVLRFRLRKMVPFDVEHAGLSYQVLTSARCWRQFCPAPSWPNMRPPCALPDSSRAQSCLPAWLLLRRSTQWKQC